MRHSEFDPASRERRPWNAGRRVQLLDMNVGDRFLLQFSLLRLGREVVGECTIDIARMRVMAFDEIGITAIHRTNEIANRVAQDGVDTTGKLVGFRNQ